MSGRRATRHAAVVVSLAAAAGLLVGPVGAVLAPALVLLARRTHQLARRRRLAESCQRALPDAMELLVLLVEAGRSPRQAVLDVARHGPPPLRDGFAAVVTRLERGDDFAHALGALHTAIGPAAAPLVDSLSSAHRYGTPLAAALDLLVAEARLQRQRRAEADARRLPVRLAAPLVLCTLPSFALLGIVPALLAALGSLGSLGSLGDIGR